MGLVTDLNILDKIEQQPQSQESLVNQLLKLTLIANKFGLYDASDFIKNHLESQIKYKLKTSNSK
jgi:hypothetical protein